MSFASWKVVLEPTKREFFFLFESYSGLDLYCFFISCHFYSCPLLFLSLWASSGLSSASPLLSCSSYGKLSLHHHTVNNPTWARSIVFPAAHSLPPPSCPAPVFCGPSDRVVGNKCSTSFIYWNSQIWTGLLHSSCWHALLGTYFIDSPPLHWALRKGPQ